MHAALYLRSSKDRSDVSIAAQARELELLAAQRGLQIVRRFEDAVETGSSEDRPGFIALIRDLKNPSRGWDHLLVYDTSRIARRRYIAQAIKHDANLSRCASGFPGGPNMLPDYEVMERIAKWIEDGAKTR